MSIEDIIKKAKLKIQLKLEYKGKTILDDETAKLLFLIDKKGSILSASKVLGIPYSRAWDWITRIEKILGMEIVKRKRGGERGGGSLLTGTGKKLLEFYENNAKKHNLDAFKHKGLVSDSLNADLIFAGSHDPLIELLLKRFSEATNFEFEIHWVGSTGGFLSIILGEADVVGCHLLDIETGSYNVPFLKKYNLENEVVVIRGFIREVSLVYSPSLEIGGVEDIVDKGIRIVNRNPGSGTRVLLDLILREIARERHVDFEELVKNIDGYDYEVKTHTDVAKAIKSGVADAGISLTYIATKYGLKFIPLRHENYDFVIRIKSLEKPALKAFLDYFRRKETREFINSKRGYKAMKDMGKIIYKMGRKL